ncbi:hypothetical protein ACFFLZ_05860 [Photobacterium aphoticum]|nr:hypothetical protein [Photobacterium aphoticum]GAL02804.1 hypothetical protein JCM19237_5697 [Photobacterium aphoticum]
MDQAESLREIFEKQASKKRLEDCQEQVRQAIRTGDNTDLDMLMMQLERAHIEFEETLNSYS